MSVDLTLKLPLSANAQFVQDQLENASPVALTTDRVGVGTLDPGTTLDLKGNMAIRDGRAINFRTDDVNTTGFIRSVPGGLELSGQIGMGTGDPGATLDLKGNMAVRDGHAINFRPDDANTTGFIASAPGGLQLSGKVGVGIATPQAQLDVGGNVKAEGLEVNGPVAMSTSDLSVSGLPEISEAPDVSRLASLVIDPETGRLYRL